MRRSGYVSAAFAASPTDVFVAAYPNYYRFDGNAWSKLSGDSYGVAAMWGNSANAIFGVGQVIRRFDGTAWTEMTSPTAERLRAVWGSSASSVYAVGQAGTIIHFDGTTWSSMTSPTTANLVGVSGASDNLVFAVAEDGSIVRFDGNAWSIAVGPSSRFLTGIWMASASLGYAIGSDGVLKFDGSTWSSDAGYSNTNGFLRAVWGSSSSNVVVVGDNGTMSRFDGTSWSTVTRRTASSLTTLTGSGASAFAFSSGVAVRQSGATSALVYSAPELKSVWAVDANTAFAVGTDGAIWRYVNGIWQYQSTGSFTTFTDVWAESATKVLAVGTDPISGSAVSYRYDGTTWQRVDMPNSGGAVSLWGSSLGNVIAGSPFSPLQRFDGSTWSAASSATPTDMTALWGTSATDILIVGSGGFAAHFDGAGSALADFDGGHASARLGVGEQSHELLHRDQRVGVLSLRWDIVRPHDAAVTRRRRVWTLGDRPDAAVRRGLQRGGDPIRRDAMAATACLDRQCELLGAARIGVATVRGGTAGGGDGDALRTGARSRATRRDDVSAKKPRGRSQTRPRVIRARPVSRVIGMGSGDFPRPEPPFTSRRRYESHRRGTLPGYQRAHPECLRRR